MVRIIGRKTEKLKHETNVHIYSLPKSRQHIPWDKFVKDKHFRFPHKLKEITLTLPLSETLLIL